MDDYMSIAALSVSMSQQRVEQNLGVAVLKEAMNAQVASTSDLLEEIAVDAVDPNLGTLVDIQA
ncbi:MAG: YjfB family protein [Selenomonadaceae bacterium]|nr:YjfB family protein [Selenomonadaceae bacterium]